MSLIRCRLPLCRFAKIQIAIRSPLSTLLALSLFLSIRFLQSGTAATGTKKGPPPKLVIIMTRSAPPPFDPKLLREAHPPWMVVSTQALATVLKVNPVALLMWRYRGAGPVAIPQSWIRGHVVAYLVSDVLNWLGDTRSQCAMFRDALGDLIQPDEANNEALIRLYVTAKASTSDSIVGAKWTSTGKAGYLKYLQL